VIEFVFPSSWVVNDKVNIPTRRSKSSASRSQGAKWAGGESAATQACRADTRAPWQAKFSKTGLRRGQTGISVGDYRTAEVPNSAAEDPNNPRRSHRSAEDLKGLQRMQRIAEDAEDCRGLQRLQRRSWARDGNQSITKRRANGSNAASHHLKLPGSHGGQVISPQ
jgi:hypothetical protein